MNTQHFRVFCAKFLFYNFFISLLEQFLFLKTQLQKDVHQGTTNTLREKERPSRDGNHLQPVSSTYGQSYQDPVPTSSFVSRQSNQFSQPASHSVRYPPCRATLTHSNLITRPQLLYCCHNKGTTIVFCFVCKITLPILFKDSGKSCSRCSKRK